MKFRLRSFVSLAAVLAVGMIGCGQEGPPRTVITGTVTYNGEPVETGDIVFTPLADTEGASSSAPIVDGQYRTDPRFAVTAGTYNVAIHGYHQKEQTKAEGDAAAHQPEGIPDPLGIRSREHYIPEKYNTQTELQPLIVSGTEGEIVKDFDLEG